MEKEIMEPSNFQECTTKSFEAQKKEMDKLKLQILQLKKELEDKQRLESEIEREEAKEKIKSLLENLKEKDEHIEDLDELDRALIIKRSNMNDEFQYAQKVLIDGLKDMPDSKLNIGVKRMGDLDYDQILAAAKKKYPADEAEEKAMKWTNLVLDKLKNPDWFPFKIIMVGKDLKEVIDEEDDFMKDKKKEWGAVVYNTVVTALTEMNEYNPCGRCPVPELWNFEQGRRATLGECVEFLLGLSKNNKRKESCCP